MDKDLRLRENDILSAHVLYLMEFTEDLCECGPDLGFSGRAGGLTNPGIGQAGHECALPQSKRRPITTRRPGPPSGHSPGKRGALFSWRRCSSSNPSSLSNFPEWEEGLKVTLRPRDLDLCPNTFRCHDSNKIVLLHKIMKEHHNFYYYYNPL
ncbi:hypothetical protein SKAU_G00024320 [Synaphobranchus kaupii]|uniref:Uncharacterized protein n=1 Tax=Synaphobranchus kaupii TaxID=118154 RepID=A0A9Q1GDT7_SYNKA|nr:hypothetical protein SKAU_G00024320 [Synaphobranchus kaupii]